MKAIQNVLVTDPDSERQFNTANVEAAVAKQFPEGDNINALMWLLK